VTGLPCRCGHLRERHVMLRARCTVEVDDKPCGCVQYEAAMPQTGLFATAITLDERLEIAEAALRRTRAMLKSVLEEEGIEEEARKAMRDNVKMRETIEAIVNNPTSSRADVQGALLRFIL
jgi:hypothetical protein